MTSWLTTGPRTRTLRAANPGPMTLTGTNSYVISGSASAELVVVDPGPLLEDHLQALAAAGSVALILLTHHHEDHSGGADRLHELTGAPVRAEDSRLCRDGKALSDGEIIHVAGTAIHVWATPGHTLDSLCFYLPEDGPNGSLLSGDTILGQGTTVLDHPLGTLHDYLESLDRLQAAASQHGPITLLPGHGPVLADMGEVVAHYSAHRLERLEQVRVAIDKLQATGQNVSADAVANLVYPEVAENLRRAAVLSVSAQLQYLKF